MKKSKNIVLIVAPVLSAALFNACGSSQTPSVVNTAPTTTTYTPNPLTTAPVETAQTRDVYNNLNDCVKDWGTKELCEQMGDEDDKDYKTRHKTGGKSRYFFGPKYSSSNRIITYKGKTISPTGKTTKMPTFVSAVPSSTTKSSTAPSTSSTSKSTTSSTSPSSSSSSSTTSPSSSYSTTTRSGFGSTSSTYSSSSSSSSSGS